MKVQKYLKYNKRGCFITSCQVSTVFCLISDCKTSVGCQQGALTRLQEEKVDILLWFSCCRGGAGEQCHINSGAVSQTVVSAE